ncbi:uncharacterized protein LOC108247140 [Kryptolebias marmoratus]|uniref:uncharacterized protein LOC108247140 n=1 Tax=Kryptolebias marmoratus TaxID=37003 RepID=UPI0018ACFEF1|nr:uncharacterized protein LOC108247140 [Kryptolebias marmoratus]
MASEPDNDHMDDVTGESLPPAQDPALPCKALQKSGGKRTLSQVYDPRVDLMQKQLEEMRKTMDIMAAAQQRLLENQAPQRTYHHPDAVSLAASGNLDKTNSSGCGSSALLDGFEDPDEDLGECLAEACDFSLEALLVRAAAAAGLPAPPSPPRASALDRGPGRHGHTLLPVYGDFVARLQESWAQPKEATAPRSALSVLHGAAEHGLDGVSRIGPSFALLAGAFPTGKVARHPNKKCRATDGLVVKSYQSAAMASRLANTNALLLVYLEGLIRDLESKSLTDLLPEMTKVMDTVIQGASAQAKVLASRDLTQLGRAHLRILGEVDRPTNRDVRGHIHAPGSVVVGEGRSPLSGPDAAHRLASAFSSTHLSAWRQCTSCPWVLQTLEWGYRLQFKLHAPRFRGVLETKVRDSSLSAILAKEISTLLSKGAIRPLCLEEEKRGFYSPYFLVPKRTGGFRPILDLRQLNKFLKVLPFRMLQLRALFQAIRDGDWFTTVDLRDAYFHIPIHPDHRCFLRFAFQGVAYEYSVLPFGLSLSPRTFTKCMDAALIPLRRRGIRVLNYLDDWLVCAPSLSLANEHTAAVLAHLTSLGLHLNAEKSHLVPGRSVEYLGLLLNSDTMRACLTHKRVSAIEECIASCLAQRTVSAQQCQRLLGLFAAAAQAVPLGLLHTRPLQHWFACQKVFLPKDRIRQLTLSRKCLKVLAWWGSSSAVVEGVPLGLGGARVTVTTDASQTGWGAVWEGRSARGIWDPVHQAWHINLLEMEAVHLALKHFLPAMRGRQVMVRTDNTAVVSYINRQGGLKSPTLHARARRLLLWAQTEGMSLRAFYLPGPLNTAADLLSRGAPHPGEWRLHSGVVSQIWDRFGQATVDLFATEDNTHCPLWFSMHCLPGPLGTDALSLPWPHATLYAFPPLPLLPALLSRVRLSRARVLLVAPCWPQRPWMAEIYEMLDGQPWRLPIRADLLSQAQGKIWHPRPEALSLHVWPLNGSTGILWA